MYYELSVEKDDNNSYLVTSPDFPEVTTFCEELKDAEKYGSEAILEAMASRLADDENLPNSHTKRSEYAFDIDLNTQIKIELWQLLHKTGKKRAELKSALGFGNQQINRLFDLNHQTKNEVLDLAFKELGCRPVIQLKQIRKRA